MEKLEFSATSIPWPTLFEALVSGLTHNISNRVAILSGISDILSYGDPPPPLFQALADEIPLLNENLRLLRLLPTSANESEEPLEVPRIIDDALALARVHPAAKGCTFEVELAPGLFPAVAPPTQLLHEIVQLVLTEALRSPDVSTVVVHARTVGDQLHVTVGDHAVIAQSLSPHPRT
jgi:hypothetical protein